MSNEFEESNRGTERCRQYENTANLSESTETLGYQRGLKDHEIQQLVNAIRDRTSPMIPHQCLREVIASATTEYLEKNGLRVDDPKDTIRIGNPQSSDELLPCLSCGGQSKQCQCDENTCGRIICVDCGLEALWKTDDYAYNVMMWNKKRR